MITNWLKDELDKGSDKLHDKIFGEGHAAEIKKMHEEGAKQFWDGVHNAASWVGKQLGIAPANAAPVVGAVVPRGPAPLVTNLPGTLGDYGSRANNPGNMNYAAWENAAGQFAYNDRQTGAEHHMAVFNSMQEGVAAVVKLLIRNQAQYGNTLAGAFRGYAEKSYFKDLGMDPNAKFDIAEVARTNPALLEKMLEAQFKHEGRSMSSGALSREQIMQGIDRAVRPGAIVPANSNSSAAGSIAGKGGVTINQQTTVQVAQGPDAATTAGHVARAQTRVNEGLVQNTAGVLR
jgi:hypothetical protein